MKKILLLTHLLLMCNMIGAQPKLGKYIINGTAYPAEDVIQQLYTFGNHLPESERRFLSCIQDALKQGRTLEYDTWSYTLKGYVNWESQLTSSQQIKYAKKGILPKDCQHMLYHLAQFQPQSRITSVDRNQNVRLNLDMSAPRFLTYLKNSDGTFRYTIDIDNIGVINRLQGLKQLKRIGTTTYYKGDPVVIFKGYNDKTLDNYISWLDSYKDLDGLINRIKTATITSDDTQVLNSIGIFIKIK